MIGRLAVRIAARIHRALTWLLPSQVRRDYGAEVRNTFVAAATAAAERGGAPAVLRLLGREIIDLSTARHANRPMRLPDPTAGRRRGVGRFVGVDLGAWRQAWRSLRRRPAYLVAGVVTIAASTAAITTVVALVDTVMIKPLPYPLADALVTLYESSPTGRVRTSLIAPARLEDWQERTRAFAAIAGSYTENVTDTSGDQPERLAGRRVTPRYFDVFGTAPIVGRTFIADEERTGGPGAAVISEAFWTRRFGRDLRAVDHALTIGGRPYPIVGVMPALFSNVATDIWLPAQLAFGRGSLPLRQARFLNGIGRLRPGVSADDGARDLVAVQAALATEFPSTDAGWSAEVRSLKEARVGDAGDGLVLLAGAVAALWLIALSNVAALTIVHVQRRARELTIRTALGASRRRVLAVVLRESAIVGAAGGLAGLALASWSVPAWRELLAGVPRIEELALDGRAVSVGVASLLLSVIVVALAPAALATGRRSGGVSALNARTIAPGRHRAQRALVVAQVALSVVLVGSATLLARSYLSVTSAPLGFDPTGVFTFHIAARWDEDRARVGQLQRDVIARLRELPYVEAAGTTNFLPATGATLRYQVRVDGLAGTDAESTITSGARMIAGGYFAAIGASVAGESCPAEMPVSSTGRALVNRKFMETHAPGQTLIGRALTVVQGGGPLTIAGVVDDIAEDGPGTTAVPYFYACYDPGGWPDPQYVVRTTSAGPLASDLRRIVAEADRTRAIFGLRQLEDVIADSFETPRFNAASMGAFAAAALALAALGVYGLFALVVADRARDIAVRFALGAAPRDVAGAGHWRRRPRPRRRPHAWRAARVRGRSPAAPPRLRRAPIRSARDRRRGRSAGAGLGDRRGAAGAPGAADRSDRRVARRLT